MYRFSFEDPDGVKVEVSGCDWGSDLEEVYMLFRAFMIAVGFTEETIDTWVYSISCAKMEDA